MRSNGSKPSTVVVSLQTEVPPLTNGRKTKVVIPISMQQRLQKGEYLNALLRALKDYDVALLVCNYIHRHNVGDEGAELEGTRFKEEHKNLFKCYSVQVLDFGKILVKDTEHSKLFNETLEQIKKDSMPGGEFYKAIISTYEKYLIGILGTKKYKHHTERSLPKTETKDLPKLENSIKYQQEEYAAIICMDKLEMFDYLVYPREMSPGIKYTYDHYCSKNKKGESKSLKYVHANMQMIRASEQFDKRWKDVLPFFCAANLESFQRFLLDEPKGGSYQHPGVTSDEQRLAYECLKQIMFLFQQKHPDVRATDKELASNLVKLSLVSNNGNGNGARSISPSFLTTPPPESTSHNTTHHHTNGAV